MNRRQLVHSLPWALSLPIGLGVTSAVRAQASAPPAVPTPYVMSGITSRGERISLEMLRGSVVLVFVWSSGCPVCLDKLPELRRNLEGWKDKPFVILALNQDRTVDNMLAYERLLDQAAPMRSQFKHLWRGSGGHRDTFGDIPVNRPTTLVFNKQGELAKNVRGRVPVELWDDIAELVLI